ncbi:MAG: hypothetical protein IPK53_06255 [bacterium]|nr:hypothetical protein [bacterium]
MNTFSDVERYLDSLINYEVDTPLGSGRDAPKLEPVRAAVRGMGLSVALPNCLHIAGTVGKGSTAAFAQVLLSLRHRTLTFTSPHLISARERVQLDGRNLPDEAWCRGMTALRDAHAGGRTPKLTYFETIWLFYLWCARELGTTAHVIETGLGGSFDATNVIDYSTAVLTRVHFDHTHILGKTLTEIARDKSGIIKPGCRCVSVAQEPEALAQIEAAAGRAKAQLLLEDRDFTCTIAGEQVHHYKFGSRAIESLDNPLRGEFQRHNLGVALTAVLAIEPELHDDEIRAAIAGLHLPGRMQTVPRHPNLLLDVCHNPASFEELGIVLRREREYSKRVALLAMMKDKDARESLAGLAGVADELWITQAPTPRSAQPDDLVESAREIGFLARTIDRETAYRELLHLPLTSQGVVCGSFYLVGDFMRWLEHA